MVSGARCWEGFEKLNTNYANLANGANTLSERNNLQSTGKGEKVASGKLKVRVENKMTLKSGGDLSVILLLFGNEYKTINL